MHKEAEAMRQACRHARRMDVRVYALGWTPAMKNLHQVCYVCTLSSDGPGFLETTLIVGFTDTFLDVRSQLRGRKINRFKL